MKYMISWNVIILRNLRFVSKHLLIVLQPVSLLDAVCLPSAITGTSGLAVNRRSRFSLVAWPVVSWA